MKYYGKKAYTQINSATWDKCAKDGCECRFAMLSL